MTNQTWKIMKFAAVVGTGVIALHGATTRKWRLWHTVFVVGGAVATIGAALTEWRSGPDHSANRQAGKLGGARSAVA
jgi:hypothetical protein